MALIASPAATMGDRRHPSRPLNPLSAEFIPFGSWKGDSGTDAVKSKDCFHYLSQVLFLNGNGSKARPGTWAITLVRVDNECTKNQFYNAIACIEDAVRRDLGVAEPCKPECINVVWNGTGSQRRSCRTRRTELRSRRTMAEDLFHRFACEVIMNNDTLKEPTTDNIRKEFHKWIVADGGNCNGGDMRYVFCIILDDETVKTLSDMWSRICRVGGTAATQVKVKALDSLHNDKCSGTYELYLRGRNGLVNFWFQRNLCRQPLSVFLTEPPERGAMWCYGPWEEVPTFERVPHTEQKKQSKKKIQPKKKRDQTAEEPVVPKAKDNVSDGRGETKHGSPGNQQGGGRRGHEASVGTPDASVTTNAGNEAVMPT